MIITQKGLTWILGATVLVLLIPLIAMQFTDEVNWTLVDFVIAGVLLVATGLVFEFVFRNIKNIKYRIAISIALLIVLLLIWAELAVGVFKGPLSGS